LGLSQTDRDATWPAYRHAGAAQRTVTAPLQRRVRYSFGAARGPSALVRSGVQIGSIWHALMGCGRSGDRPAADAGGAAPWDRV